MYAAISDSGIMPLSLYVIMLIYKAHYSFLFVTDHRWHIAIALSTILSGMGR
jgi:hypothetical protein